MARTLVAAVRHEPVVVKGSRFVATTAPVGSEPEAKDVLASVAAELSDASHHCWAWRLAAPAIDRAGDDGEPAGSAGRPILAQLVGRELIDAVVVVTRYFGGTKLGVGGLIRAYGGSAGQALEWADTVEWRRTTTFDLVHSHADMAAVSHALEAVGAVDLEVSYGEAVRRIISAAVEQLEPLQRLLADATAGRVRMDLEAAERGTTGQV